MIMHPVGLYGASALSAGTGLGLLGNSVVNAYRASKTGNRRAKAKLKRFQKEMNTAFKGYKGNSKKAKQNDFAKNLRGDLKNGAKSAALSTVMGPYAATYVNSKNVASGAPKKKSKKRRR